MTADVLSVVHDPRRLKTLRELGLLDSPAEEAFDRLARLASRLLHVPIALVTLVDADRQFFKSCLGLPEPWSSWRETPLSHSFCQHTVAAHEPLVISDARDHPLVRDNLAIRDLNVVAYLGIPLTMPNGETIGSFCVIDSVPRIWAQEEIDTMHELATSVISEITLSALQRTLEREVEARTVELERANEVLKENEERLRLALNAGRMGIFDWNVASDVIIWSEEHARLFGMRLEDFKGRYASFAQRVHQDDLAGINQALEDARLSLSLFHQEFRVVWPDGSLHWISSQGRFFYDAEGQELRMTGVVMDIDARKGMEITLRGDKRVMEMIAQGAPLSELLATITRNVESLSSDTLCSILLLDADGLHLRHGAAPSLPESFNQAIDGGAIGPKAGSCGTAAYLNQAIIVTDIATDPLWADYRALALQHGLHACWSTPIRSAEGKILGTFALYYHEPRSPGPADFELIERSTHLTGIAIERKQTEEALRASELYNRLLFERSPIGLALCRMDGTLVDINPAYAAIIGRSIKETIGLTYWQITPEDYTTQEAQQLELLRTTGRYGPYEKEYLHRDNHRVPVRLSGLLIDKGGETFIWSSVEDITERKLAEQALITSERHLRNILDSLFVFVGVMTPDGTLTLANRAPLELAGLQPQDVLGKPFPDAYWWSYSPAVQKRLWDAIRRVAMGEIVRYDESVRLKNDQYIIIDFTLTPMFDPNGRVTHLIPSGIDITDRKHAEAALQQLTQQLEKRVADRTADLEAFTYMVAHDLRAPLRGMQGMATILLEDYGERIDADGSKYLQRIVMAAERLDQLISDLLVYSRVSRESVKVVRVELASAVQEAWSRLNTEGYDIQPTMTVTSQLPAVLGHQTIVVQILNNFFANAIKFVSPNVIPQIKVYAELRNGNVRLWVEDNGIGIQPEYQERIFGIFERLHAGDAYAGTGIGLAIVRKGIERINGKVGVESKLGEGSRFWIELPRAN